MGAFLMALNDDSAAIGRTSQKEPEKMGRLRQKALDLGMGVDEYILHVADKVSNAEKETKANDLTPAINAMQTAIAELAKEVRRMQETPKIQHIQPAQEINPFGQLSGLLGALTSLQNYNNSVIKGYKDTLEDASSLIPIGEGGEEPSDPILMLFEKMLSTPSGIPQHTTNPGVGWNTPPAPEPPAPSMDNKTIQEKAALVPQNIKEGIKSGAITKEMALSEGKKQYPNAKEEDISSLYDHIKNGTI